MRKWVGSMFSDLCEDFRRNIGQEEGLFLRFGSTGEFNPFQGRWKWSGHFELPGNERRSEGRADMV